MKDQKVMYTCAKCGKQVEKSKHDIPECCGQKMQMDKLKPCTHAMHAEMVRNTDDDGPCDEARGENIKTKP